MPSKEEVVEALRQVEDPELGMDIVELGLFYDAEIDGPNVTVQYTLTSMGCPAGAMIQEDIERAVGEIPGVGEVRSDLTFEPPRTPDKMRSLLTSPTPGISPTARSMSSWIIAPAGQPIDVSVYWTVTFGPSISAS